MTEQGASEELRVALENSGLWLNQLNELHDGLSFTRDSHNRVTVPLFHLCIEYHGGIHLLTANEVYGSAPALLRPQLEAYLREAWCTKCATEEQVEAFINGKEPPKADVQIAALENKKVFEEGMNRPRDFRRLNSSRRLSDEHEEEATKLPG